MTERWRAASCKLQPIDITPDSNVYPVSLRRFLGDRAPNHLFLLGNDELLRDGMVGLFCSVKCPGNLILKTYDLARELRDAGVPLISGFHSPMEKECLSILLRGKQPVIWCPARRLTIRGVPREYRAAIEERRLLMISPFDEKIRRPTTKTAHFRNDIVSALASKVFVVHAAPGGKVEALCREILEWGMPLFTFDAPETAGLRQLGALPVTGLSSITEGGP